MAKTGCVQGHTAFIFDRGGKRRIDQLIDLSMVRWERTRDGISEATIRLEGSACSEQAALIESLRSHRHELVIFRGNQRVWEGPIHRIGSYATYVEIVAKDVLAYLFATPLTRVWDNSFGGGGGGPTEMTSRLQQIIEWEMTHDRSQIPIGGVAPVTVTAWENLDPPANVIPYLTVPHWPNEAKTSAKTLAYEMTVGEHLQSSARTSGIDFTTVGRGIYIWDVSRSLGRLPQMTEADFYSTLAVTEYGADHAQSAYVVGQEGMYGSSLNLQNLDYYGPWTTIYTAYNEEATVAPTQPELDSQADRNLAGRSPAPIEVRVPDNSGVVLTDTLTINHLVCGVQVPILATLNARRLSQLQKIDHLTVIETSEGESVRITLTPATRADSDEEED